MGTEFASASLTVGQLNAIVKKLGGHDRALMFLRGELVVSEVERQTVLRLLSAYEQLFLDACDGTQIIADAKNVFQAGIDSDFRKWKADEKGEATPETPVQVYELAQNATFSQMFGLISNDLNKICLTQNQIIGFVKKHKKWLRKDGYATFFLFKSHNQFFVASVGVYGDVRLHVGVGRFEYDHVCYAENSYRVVIPQLAACR